MKFDNDVYQSFYDIVKESPFFLDEIHNDRLEYDCSFFFIIPFSSHKAYLVIMRIDPDLYEIYEDDNGVMPFYIDLSINEMGHSREESKWLFPSRFGVFEFENKLWEMKPYSEMAYNYIESFPYPDELKEFVMNDMDKKCIEIYEDVKRDISRLFRSIEPFF